MDGNRVAPAETLTLLLADSPDDESGHTLTDVFASHGGVLPQRPGGHGDVIGVLAAFSRASDALAAAVQLQRAPDRLRIGVHTGEIQLAAEADGTGPVVRKAAQLRDLANPGQTLLSGVTRDLAGDRLPAEVWLLDLGTRPLPGGSHPERVAQLCHPDLTNQFPPLRAGEPATVRRLPVQLTSFVGRGTELAEVRRLVGGNRLVSLTGAGGVGKSRLAVQLAGMLADEFDGEVWWVDLASATDPDLVAVRAARALGLPDQAGRSTLGTLIRFVGEQRTLIVLDNCEHLLTACAALMTSLLGACPGLTIVATSREPIGVAGEVTWRTPSLPIADEAIELFTDRARLARPDFAGTAGEAAAVAEICRRLDGIPLAIELAAARVRALSVTEILDGLRDRFRLLTGGSRTAVRRQQTLRASVEWSHALLSGPERVLFRRLAVFLGGFDLAGAYTVVGDPDVPRHQIFDELSLLVDKSLVATDDAGPDTRYRLLETVRQYALEKLVESGEADAVRTRHRDRYTELATAAASTSVGYRDRIERMEVELDNFRAAFAWSQDNGDTELTLRLASALQPLWLRGRTLEGLAWFDAALGDGAAATSAAAAYALADKTTLDAISGVFGRLDQVEPALAIARDLGDPALLSRVLTACGATVAFSAQLAAPYFEEAISLARTLGDDWQLSQALGWQGLSAFMAGYPAAACTAAEEGRDLADAIGDRFISRMCRWHIGFARCITADLAEAAAKFRDVAAEAEAAHDPLWQTYSLFGLAKMLAYQGDTDGARAAAEAAVEIAADISGFQQALSLGALADAALAAGDTEAAAAAAKAAWETCPQPDLLAVNAFPMAQTALAAGELSEARRWADEAVSAALGGHRMILLATRIRVAIAQGDFERADQDVRAALTIPAETGAYLMIADVIECLAGLWVAAGAYRQAVRLFGSAAAIRNRTGQVRYQVYEPDYRVSLTVLRAQLGDQGFESCWAEGAALSTDEAIAEAQHCRDERRRPADGWASLTPTELDVVRLVSEGLTNKDIAVRQVVSPRTVQTHLTHVYTKLGLTSRVQLIQEAVRHF